MSSPEPHLARGGRMGTGLSLVSTAVIVALATVLLVGVAACGTATAIRPAATSTASPSVPANWQTYHDPVGLYSLRLPLGWKAYVGKGLGQGPEAYSEPGTFSNPSQGTGSAQVAIIAYPIQTAADRQWICQHSSWPNIAFTGLLAIGPGPEWLFTVGNASYQIDATIPGVEEPPHTVVPFLPMATPLPATWIATDQSEMNQILVSFHPTDPKPLTC